MRGTRALLGQEQLWGDTEEHGGASEDAPTTASDTPAQVLPGPSHVRENQNQPISVPGGKSWELYRHLEFSVRARYCSGNEGFQQAD